MRTTMIYVLCSPDGQIRYLGKTNNPKRRFYVHMQQNVRTHCCAWIKSLVAAGEKPQLEVIEEIVSDDDQDWIEAEKFWISYLRFLGCNLTNLSTGGEGMYGCKHTEEWKIDSSARQAGKVLSNATKEKIRLKHLGKKLSKETCAKLSAIRKGRVLSCEHIEKVAAWHRGKKRSEESRARMSAAQIGNTSHLIASEAAKLICTGSKHSDAHIEKCRIALTGKKRTPEQIERIRLAQIKSFQEGRSGIHKATEAAALKTRGKKQSDDQIDKRVASRKATMAKRMPEKIIVA